MSFKKIFPCKSFGPFLVVAVLLAEAEVEVEVGVQLGGGNQSEAFDLCPKCCLELQLQLLMNIN